MSVHHSTCSVHFWKLHDASVVCLIEVEIIRWSKDRPACFTCQGDYWLLPDLQISTHLVEKCRSQAQNGTRVDLRIWTDKLDSSVQVYLAGSLHDYVTLLQVHNSFFFMMTFFYSKSQTYSDFFFTVTKNNMTMTQNCHYHAYPNVCSALFCVTSQYSKIYMVNDFQ